MRTQQPKRENKPHHRPTNSLPWTGPYLRYLPRRRHPGCLREPRRIAAGGICRVGMAGRPTTPLTEPDLWASHPALWNEFFMVKQRKLTRDQLHSV